MGSEPEPGVRSRTPLAGDRGRAGSTWPPSCLRGLRETPSARPPSGAWSSRLLVVAREVVSEQLRTPGQLLLGTRTVDRRTGAPVEVWRRNGRAHGRRGSQRRGVDEASSVIRRGAGPRPGGLPHRDEQAGERDPHPTELSRKGRAAREGLFTSPGPSSVRYQSAAGGRALARLRAHEKTVTDAASPRRSRCWPGRAEITGRRSGR